MMLYSPVHLFVLVVMLLVFGYPVARIIQRTGHSPWWFLLMFVPIGNIIGLWVFAHARWPATDAPLLRN